MLAQQISSTVRQAYAELNLQNNDLLSFFNFVQLMTQLGYVSSFNDNEKALLNDAWQCLLSDNSASNNISD